MNLIIFDIDGTLADRDTHQLLPGVWEWYFQQSHMEQLAIATNQGGVGLHYWMERDGFGDLSKYPDETAAREHINKVLSQLDPRIKVYVCFAYQSQKSGKWSPVPEGQEDNPEWDKGYRKPDAGMLLKAMNDANVAPEDTLFVGDDIEDAMAAKKAKCKFMFAYQFFNRESPETITARGGGLKDDKS